MLADKSMQHSTASFDLNTGLKLQCGGFVSVFSDMEFVRRQYSRGGLGLNATRFAVKRVGDSVKRGR